MKASSRGDTIYWTADVTTVAYAQDNITHSRCFYSRRPVDFESNLRANKCSTAVGMADNAAGY
jgi:hypothetical protein